MLKEYADSRDKMIASVVKGRSFVDVGALWGTRNEKLSVAHRYGASSLAVLDQFPKNSVWWRRLRKRLNFPYQKISSSLLGYSGMSFDVVYCSGVIYHSPSPLEALQKLYSMTNETMILTTIYADEVMECPWGQIEIPSSGMLFIPALTLLEFSVVQYVVGQNNPSRIWGITEHVPPERWEHNTWHWWWLFTAHTVESMLKVVNFKIVEKMFQPGNLVTFKLAK